MLYDELARAYEKGIVSFKDVTTFNLDEYIGLERDHPQSYRYFMQRHLFDCINLPEASAQFPEQQDELEVHEIGPDYEKRICDAGGIDLQVLGLGANGHIGFNEPTSSLGSRTRIKTLTRQTMEDNARMFEATEFQPNLAVTMGVATIMDARRIVLVATGSNKADAVRAAVEGPVAAIAPASNLQHHQKVKVVIDRAAAQGLKLSEYYEWVYEQNNLIYSDSAVSSPIDIWL